MPKCSCCGVKLREAEVYYVCMEWKRKGYRFCGDCVMSKKARAWVVLGHPT